MFFMSFCGRRCTSYPRLAYSVLPIFNRGSIRRANIPRIHLTKSAIDRLPVAAKDNVYWDEALPGFGVKVTPKGRKVFIAMYRTAGAGSRVRKYTIGPYGRVTLAMARAHAQKIFAARLEGRDLAEEKRQSRRRLVVDRLDALVERFVAERAAKLRSARKITNLLRRDVLPHWGTTSIHEVKKRDIIDLLGQISQRSPHAAYRLLKILKTFFRWCVGRAIIENSPAEGIPSHWRETSRDRVLTDLELSSIVRSVRQMSWPYSGVVEFLALTGQRREEVAQMKWDELDRELNTWHIPASRSKNNKAHIVHLSKPAAAILERRERTSDYVFGTGGSKSFQSFGKAKKALDASCGVSNWRLHDLRRTVVSGMAGMGIPPHVADKILNHQSGTISGVAAVYQRHEFLKERKEALDRWGAHVAGLVAGSEAMPEAAE